MASLKEKMGVPKPLAASIIAWAIKAPDGKILRFGKSLAVYAEEYQLGPDGIRDGYRCVRVTLQEMQE